MRRRKFLGMVGGMAAGWPCSARAQQAGIRAQLNVLALEAQLPTMYALREYLEGGGLMSYGPDIPDSFRRATDYIDKILRGVKPRDLPVQQPTKFEMMINLKTAKALGITVPPTLLARTDDVIE